MRVYLFACIEKNIGDDLFVKLLCERYPDIVFVITSKAKYGSLKRIPNLVFSDVLKKWNWASSLCPNNKIKSVVAKVIQVYYTFKLPKYKIGVSIVGNAFKNPEYSGWAQSRWIREKIKLVDKFYIMSTNFGPYKDERWKTDFEKIFSTMSDVCFRDKYSFDLFSNLSNVRFAPDAVFTMGKKQHENNKNVIISVIDCSFYARNENLKKVAPVFEKKMAETIDILYQNGYTVTLLNSNTEQDKPACKRILKMIGSHDISVVDYDGDLDLIFELYKHSSFVIGTRLHTIILGWLYNMSVVPIVYDIKVSNLLDACSYNQALFDITQLDCVTGLDIVNALVNNHYVVSKDILDNAQNQFLKLDDILLKGEAKYEKSSF